MTKSNYSTLYLVLTNTNKYYITLSSYIRSLKIVDADIFRKKKATTKQKFCSQNNVLNVGVKIFVPFGAFSKQPDQINFYCVEQLNTSALIVTRRIHSSGAIFRKACLRYNLSEKCRLPTLAGTIRQISCCLSCAFTSKLKF